MSADYLNDLEVHVKGFYLFLNSAHSSIFEEPKKVLRIIQEDIINGKNDLADIK